MARPSRFRGPHRDPRLLERQGDLWGPSALLLVLLMVCGIGLMGALLVGFGRLLPSPAPTIQRTAAPASTPRPPRSTPSAGSPTPSTTPVPTASSVAIVDPGVILVAAGDAAPITERGQQVGTVTLDSAVFRPSVQGRPPAAGTRWLRVSLTFRATATLPYDAGRWSALDANGKRHRWSGAAAPDPALGGGSLDAGQSRTGYLVIAVPLHVAIPSLVLEDADGHDIDILGLR